MNLTRGVVYPYLNITAKRGYTVYFVRRLAMPQIRKPI